MDSAIHELVAKALPTDARAFRAHPDVTLCVRGDSAVAVLPVVAWRKKNIHAALVPRLHAGTMALVLVGDLGELGGEVPDDLFAMLPRGGAAEAKLVLSRAFEFLDTKSRAESRGQWLTRYRYELGELIEIARAMTTERDVNRLLSVILEKSRYVTGADAGSIYTVEDDGRTLRFKLSQNDSVAFDSREFTMPLSNQSIGGSAAMQKRAINLEDVYALGSESPFQFDQRFDEKIGYRTRSMLTVPLISQKGDAIGVIQLINKKRDPTRRVPLSRNDVETLVVPFDQRSEEILGLVATQAAIALENAMLYAEIQRLFEGFVTASVEAIESRDPTTSGHSRRVANLTVELAKIVDSEQTGAYREARFSKDDLRELEYASLLHDFGKIGVRESVLVKGKKLYDERLEHIRQRFELALRAAEVDALKRKIALLERGARAEDMLEVEVSFQSQKRTLETALAAIMTANEPSVLPEGEFAKIEEIAKETFRDFGGEPRWLLEKDEVHALMVRKGSLTPAEYDEIASHVSHTFRFLSRIPWGSALRRVPLIAGAHHERLNGTGYPHRLRAEEIPVGAKMMSIADIFDALTASDRPYKKAVPVERAIDIINFGVRDGHVDAELVRMFRDARVWERAAEKGAKKP